MTTSDPRAGEATATRAVPPQPRLPDDERAAFETLRGILLHDQSRTIGEQERRLHELETLLNEDARLVERLAPTLGASIRRRIAEAPDDLVEAFYPVIVPLIGRAVAESIRDLARSIDAQMRRMLNLRLLLRLQWARLRGVDAAELLLREALPFQPRELLLIHRESGLLLAYCAQGAASSPDLDLISGMLTAIRDFTRDAFGESQPGSLDEIQYGERRVLIEGHRHAYLAAVIDGVEPRDYRQQLRHCLIAVDQRFGAELQQYQGDAARLDGAASLMRPLLQATPAPRGLTGSQRVILGGCGALLVAALLLVCGFAGLWLRQLAARPNVPAYIVVLPPTPIPSASPMPSPTAAPTARPTPTRTSTPPPSATPAPVVGQMTGSVWVHEGPGGETARVGVIAFNGQAVRVLGAAGTWLLVAWESEGSSYSGWAPAQYVRAEGPVPTITPALPAS